MSEEKSLPTIRQLKAILLDRVAQDDTIPDVEVLKLLRDLAFQDEGTVLQKWLDGLVDLQRRVGVLEMERGMAPQNSAIEAAMRGGLRQ